MIEVQSSRVETMLAPDDATVATNTTQVGYLDTLGSDGVKWDYATIITMHPTAATTSAVASVLKLTEGTNSAAATAIVAFTGGTATSTSVGFVIPAFTTAEGAAVVMDVDLRKRERYLKMSISPNTTARPVVLALLTRGKAMPGSDLGSVPSGAHVIG